MDPPIKSEDDEAGKYIKKCVIFGRAAAIKTVFFHCVKTVCLA